MTRSINILYFAWVRERIGIAEEQVSLAEEVNTIADILKMLTDRDATYAAVLSDPEKLRFALDQDYGTPASSIGSARELAIFPPVTGG